MPSALPVTVTTIVVCPQTSAVTPFLEEPSDTSLIHAFIRGAASHEASADISSAECPPAQVPSPLLSPESAPTSLGPPLLDKAQQFVVASALHRRNIRAVDLDRHLQSLDNVVDGLKRRGLDIASLDSFLKTLEEDSSSLYTALNTAQTENKTLQDLVSKFEQGRNKLLEHEEAKNATAQAQINLLQRQLEAAGDLNSQLMQQATNQKEANQQLEDTTEDLIRLSRRNTDTIAAMERKTKDMERQLSEVTKQLAAKQQVHDQLLQRLKPAREETMDGEYLEPKHIIRELETRNVELSCQLQKIEGKCFEMKTTTSQLEARNDELSRQLLAAASSQSEIDSALNSQAYQRKVQELREAAASIDWLTKENDNLRHSNTQALQAMNDRVKEWESWGRSWEAWGNSIYPKLEDAQQENLELRKQVTCLQNTVFHSPPIETEHPIVAQSMSSANDPALATEEDMDMLRSRFERLHEDDIASLRESYMQLSP